MTFINSSCSWSNAPDLDKAENILMFVNLVKEHLILLVKSIMPVYRKKNTVFDENKKET